MGRLLNGTQQASFIQGKRQRDLRKRINGVQVDPGYFGRVFIKGNIPHKMFGQGWMIGTDTNIDGHIEPLPTLDGHCDSAGSRMP